MTINYLLLKYFTKQKQTKTVPMLAMGKQGIIINTQESGEDNMLEYHAPIVGQRELAEWQAEGATKAPFDLLTEVEEGRCTLAIMSWTGDVPPELSGIDNLDQFTCDEGDKKLILIRGVESLPIIVRTRNGHSFWHEYQSLVWGADTYRIKQRRYPFPAIAKRTDEDIVESLDRGLEKEFGLNRETDAIGAILLHTTSVFKASLTAGVVTHYIFRPWEIDLISDECFKSNAPDMLIVPSGEVWRIDATDPGVVHCFRKESVIGLAVHSSLRADRLVYPD